MAVELDHVAKHYRLGGRGGPLGARRGEVLRALRDVSLRVEPGECVGLIGHNGAGKTTVLRLLAGITRPTSGRVRTRGRLASLINLGAGFHPELTGRENILLNGVILGLTRAQVRARFEQIVEFADLGPFIDTPLKRYSSGMYARLGFAVAAHVDPDVLLVDEVLSVGDVAFQDRSVRKMLSFRDQGRAILFVSHNLSAVEMMCQRVIWLEHGRIRQEGPTADVVQAYLAAVDEALVQDASLVAADEQQEIALVETSLHDGAGELRTDFAFGDILRVRLRWHARQPLRGVHVAITVRGDYGPLFSARSRTFAAWAAGSHEVECAFQKLPLLPGLYRVEVALEHAETPPWRIAQPAAAFRLTSSLSAFGSDSPVGTTKSRGGFLAVAYDWRVRSASGEQVLAGLRLPSPDGPQP